jgi:hypothetical protein
LAVANLKELHFTSLVNAIFLKKFNIIKQY